MHLGRKSRIQGQKIKALSSKKMKVLIPVNSCASIMTVKQITNNIKRIIIWKFVLSWLLNNYYVCRFIDRLKVKPQYSGLYLK